MRTWLDIAVVRCPNCGNIHADAAWYLIELESDIQCGRCQTEFNAKDHTTDRALIEFTVDDEGKITRVRVGERVTLE